MSRVQSGSFQWWANYNIVLYYTISDYWYSNGTRYANFTIDRIAHSCSQYDFTGTATYSASGTTSASGTVTIPRSGSNNFSGELGVDVGKTIQFAYDVNGNAIGSIKIHIYNYSVLWISQGYRVPFDFTQTWGFGSLASNIGPAYTTPNIAIDSLNGVNIARGEGNYQINLNANQNITIGYSEWAGSIASVDRCSIDAWIKPYDRNKGNLSWKTVLNNGNGRPAGSVYYKQYNNSNDSYNLMGSGVPFSYDGQYVWLYIQRHHSVSGVNSPQILHTNIRLIKVLYTPIKSVNITQQPESVLTSKTDINFSWDYPSNSSNINQNGIVSGYEIRLIRKSNGAVEFTATTTYKNYTLSRNNYKALREYYVQIVPYYQVNSSKKSYGPIKNTSVFQVISDLPKPSIDYPKTGNNCVWIGNKFHVLSQLPTDPDYEDLENKAEYFYRDIEVNINNISYKYSTHKNQFSVTNLPHNIKFAFTTKGLNINFNTNYVIKVRVQKNYGSYKWSEYQTINLNSVTVPQIPVFNGYIMASHYTSIYNYISKMRNCYKPSGISLNLNNITKGSYILRDDYQKSYNELSNISNLIDTWGEYNNQFVKVQFSVSNKFVPKIEYITNIDNDTNPIGHNYFIQAYNWIRFYG